MKKRIISIITVLLSLLMLASLFTVAAGASSAYQTYTYSISGEPLYSPDAYTAFKSLNYVNMGMELNFNNPTDLVTDSDGHGHILSAGAHGNHFVDCGLFLGSGSQNDAGNGSFLSLMLLQQNIICHGFEFHFQCLQTVY